MRLFSAPTSPYCAKVLLVCAELKLDSQIDYVLQMPRDAENGFHALAPLARIPVLEIEDGLVLADSTVICEYLNDFAAGSLFPRASGNRWRALNRQAIGDGLLDTLLPLRHERLRPASLQSSEVIDRLSATTTRVLDWLEANDPGCDGDLTIGDLAIATALLYLDFRFPELSWRSSRPKLRDWLSRLMQRPSFASMPLIEAASGIDL